jgi:hypothetical protein
MPKATPQAAEMRLQLDGWYKACKAAGLDSDNAVAKALDVSTVQVWRVQTGENAPGNRFMAGVVRVFGWESLPSIFEVVGGVSQDVAA